MGGGRVTECSVSGEGCQVQEVEGKDWSLAHACWGPGTCWDGVELGRVGVCG